MPAAHRLAQRAGPDRVAERRDPAAEDQARAVAQGVVDGGQGLVAATGMDLVEPVEDGQDQPGGQQGAGPADPGRRRAGQPRMLPDDLGFQPAVQIVPAGVP